MGLLARRLGGLAFARGRRPRRALRRVAVGTCWCSSVCAAAAHTVLVWKHFPIFRILYIKGSFEARPLYEKWNSYSRVRVNGDANAWVEPQGWGLSRTLPGSARVHQLQMDIDVVAGTVMTGYDGDPAVVRHLGYDVTNLALRRAPGGRRAGRSAPAAGATCCPRSPSARGR